MEANKSVRQREESKKRKERTKKIPMNKKKWEKNILRRVQ